MDFHSSSFNKVILVISAILLFYPVLNAFGIDRDDVYPKPARIIIVSGDKQSGPAGSALPEPLVVKVLGTNNIIAPGVEVKFTIVEGGGTLSHGSLKGAKEIALKTDFTGKAGVMLTLGKSKGMNSVKASVEGLAPVTFTATAINSGPKLNPIGNKQVDEGGVLRFTVSVYDADPDDTLTLSASALPANAHFDPSTGVFTFTPDYTQSGVYLITFTVSDGSLVDTETITITVRNVNRPPILNPIGNRTVDENKELVIIVSAMDPDGDALTYSAEGLPEGAVFNASQRTFRWTPGFNTVKSGDKLNFYITFTVIDTEGASDSERVTITVNDVAPPPMPDIRVFPSTINFGSVPVGEFADRFLQSHNDGNVPLKISSITSTDPQFMVVSYLKTLSQIVDAINPEVFQSLDESAILSYLPAGSKFIDVAEYPILNPGECLLVKTRFIPTSAGSKTGQLVINSNDPDSPNVGIVVKGVATQTPDIRLSVSSIDFGEVEIGSSADRILQVYNDGNTVLKIYDMISTDPQFTISGYSDVAPSGKITVTVKFIPSSIGLKTAKLTVVSNDPDETILDVSLQGKGIKTSVPDIRVLPTSLDFGEVEVGKSLIKEFNIYNDGDAVLQISSITSSDPQFAILSDPDVQPGGVAVIPVRFTPVSLGLKAGIITITSNDPDTPTKTVSVQGKGIAVPAPDIRVVPTSIDFGEVGIGASLIKEFRIYNDGDALLKISSITSSNPQFVILDDPNVQPGKSVAIPVRFTPVSLGLKTGIITITSNDPDTPTKVVSVQGKGIVVPAPDIRVVPTSLDFGEVGIGTSLTKEFRIYNDGDAVLQVSSITSSNAQFVVITGDLDIQPGKSVAISVRFTPSSSGIKAGTIAIVSNDPDTPTKVVSVQGKGIVVPAPDIRVVPTSLDFGEVGIGTSLTKEFRIYNDGDAVLQISSITSSNAQFVVITGDLDIQPGKSVAISVRFTPSSSGIKTGTIAIVSNDPDTPTKVVSVQGKGIVVPAPDIRIVPTNLDFGEVEVGTSLTKEFRIYNDGDAVLQISSITSSNAQFVVTYGPSVSPGGVMTVSVRFTPLSAGAKSATITIVSNDTDEPSLSVWVYGVGVYIGFVDVGKWKLIQQTNLLSDLNDVYFVDEDRGWIVGNNGTIARSGDGGFTWTPLYSGTSRHLSSVYFADSNNGWAVGQYGTILQTTNGGYSWSLQTVGANNLNAVNFIGSIRGWIVGDAGTILSTTNGYVWTYQNSGTLRNLNDVCFVNYYQGWAVGDGGIILRTNDSGQTWTSQYSGTVATLYSVDFLNPYEGWVVGSDGVILHTRDGGQTWSLQNSRVYERLTDIDFINYNEGLAVGYNGVLLRTSNGGSTWWRADSRVTQALSSVEFFDIDNAWAVGSYGTVLKYYPDTVPAITSVSVFGSPAHTGDVIRVVATGQAYNSAKFSISGVVTNVTMTESPPGTYTGNYTVTEGINVVDATVTVTLTDRYGNTATDTSRKVTIDTIATINWASFSPNPAKPGDTVTVTVNGEPASVVKFSIETIVTDVSMTESVSVAGSYYGSYVVPQGAKEGYFKVSVKLTDKLGNTAIKDLGQLRIIDSIVQITSVSITGSPAKSGEPIVVTMIGEAGGVAKFSIIGLVSDVPMTENPSGVYTGKYVAPKGVNVKDSTVTVKLTDAQGNTAEVFAGKVTIDTESKIVSVTVLGSPGKAGGKITVTMVGEPNGLAKFSIAGGIADQNMSEQPPGSGNYYGIYTIMDNVNVTNAVLTVTLVDAVGNIGTDSSQRVTIDNIAPKITSVSVSGSPAKIGETIGITVVGETGASAWFSIAGVVKDVPMYESAIHLGTYTGAYTVTGNISVQNAVLTVTLKDPAGNITTDTSKTITITPSWDVNSDGTVNVSDLVLVGKCFGKVVSGKNGADTNNDGYVNVIDLALVVKHFNESSGSTSPGKMKSLDPDQLLVLKELYESIKDIPGDDPDLMLAKRVLASMVGSDIPDSFQLMQNFPNPFNPDTWIPYRLAEPGDVIVHIYNSSGQLVRQLDLGYKQAGDYSTKERAIYWDGTNELGEKVSSGVYFYSVESGNSKAVRKMIMAK